MPSEWHDYTTSFFEDHPSLAGGYRISPDPVRVTMEALMATTYDQDEVSSPFFRRLRQEGPAKGEAKALVKSSRPGVSR